MKLLLCDSINLFELCGKPQLWLLGIMSSLAAIHLTLVDQIAEASLFVLGTIFWVSVISLLWQKRFSLSFDSSFFSSLVGGMLIAVVLTKGAFQPTSNFLGVSPFLSALGVGLMASGLRGLTQYWRELMILFFFGVPKVLLWPLIDISAFSAKLAAFILWYSGFEVQRQRFDVLLPKGGVNVNMGCSGLEGMFYLLGLSILALVLFPLSGRKKFWVPAVAMSLAFIVNGFRIALMAFFAGVPNQEALDYWHVGDGSLVFSLISVVLFGFFYLFLLKQEDTDNLDMVEP